jgi:hypothetical protein
LVNGSENTLSDTVSATGHTSQLFGLPAVSFVEVRLMNASHDPQLEVAGLVLGWRPPRARLTDQVGLVTLLEPGRQGFGKPFAFQ